MATVTATSLTSTKVPVASGNPTLQDSGMKADTAGNLALGLSPASLGNSKQDTLTISTLGGAGDDASTTTRQIV